MKWIGAMLIVAGCGGCGFAMAASHRRETDILRQLIHGINDMECELQYRLTPLPQLCRQAGKAVNGCVRTAFLCLAEELEQQISPDVESCMNAVLAMCSEIPPGIKPLFRELGICLGRFDLSGQLQGLEYVRAGCRSQLELMSKNADVRLRSYQTLGLCAGAALAILFV